MSRVITPEQRKWSNDYLNLLGESPSEAAPPVSSSGPADDGPAEPLGEIDRFGKGLLERGYANYKKTALPPALASALTAPSPKMIDVKTWNSLALDPVAAQAAKTLVAEHQLKAAELEKWKRINDKIAAALEAGPKTGGRAGRNVKAQPQAAVVVTVDLNPDENRVLSAADLDNVAILNHYATQQTAVQDALKINPDKAAAILTLADSPRNNPERETVGKALAKLDWTEISLGGKPGQESKYAEQSFKQLLEVQKALLTWNDRRTRQNLPPTAEAVALGDLVQQVQLKVMKGIIDRKEPLPLNENLSAEETQKVQKTWENLLNDSGPPPLPGDQIRVRKFKADDRILDTAEKPDPNNVKKLTADQAASFRTEVLTNFANLLQVPAGRTLIDKINQGRHPVRFEPGTEAGASAGAPTDKKDSTVKSQGAPTVVLMPPGGKNSDTMLATKDGNPLYSPEFITLGHELVHAFHNSRGTNQRDATVDRIPKNEMAMWKAGGMKDAAEWTHMEEYQTIFKGKMSEQTLRAQCGLSAVRHGHSAPAQGSTAMTALANELDTYLAVEEKSKKVGDIDLEIVALGFEPGTFTDKQKLELLANKVKGPLPPGWVGTELSVEQIQVVITQQLHYPAFRALGWSPFDLTAKTLVLFLERKACHDRTPTGLSYRKFGGDAAFQSIKEFVAVTKATAMPSAPADELADPFAGVCTPRKLAALDQASKSLDVFIDGRGGDILDSAARSEARASAKFRLPRRLTIATKYYQLAMTMVAAPFMAADLDRLATDTKADEGDNFRLVMSAMRELGVVLAENLQGKAESRFRLDKLIENARTLTNEYLKEHKNPILNKDAIVKRNNACTAFNKSLDLLEQRAAHFRSRALETLKGTYPKATYTLEDVTALQTIMSAPFLDLKTWKMVNDALSEVEKTQPT